MSERPLGTLIKAEPLPRGFWPAGAAAAYRIFYQGLAYDGGRRLVTGSAFIPQGQAPEDGWPVVAFAHGTTGLADVAAPSRAGLSKLERQHVGGWLGAGFAVAATDYEGLATPGPHPYFNGEAVADDVIDAVRATHQLEHPISPAWLVSGFSQGGHAAMFTALIATAYAPELDFRGTIALGAPVALRELIAEATQRGGDPAPALAPILLAGLKVSNPDFHPEEFLTEEGIRLLQVAESSSMLDVMRAAITLSNDDTGFTGLAERPEVARVLDAAAIPVTRMDRPVLLSIGEADEYVPIKYTEGFADQLRDAGTEVSYTKHPGINHAGILVAAQREAVDWTGGLGGEAVTPAGDSRFSLMDATGDGYLSRDDYQVFALRLVQALGEPPRSEKASAVRDGYLKLWHAVSKADTDDDAKVSEAEFLEWIRGEVDFDAVVGPLAQAVLRLVDTDGSGHLSEEELRRVLLACRLTEEEAAQTIAALDTDRSGEVDEAEIVAGVRASCRGEGTAGNWLFGKV